MNPPARDLGWRQQQQQLRSPGNCQRSQQEPTGQQLVLQNLLPTRQHPSSSSSSSSKKGLLLLLLLLAAMWRPAWLLRPCGKL
jgi:hypothetical protein